MATSNSVLGKTMVKIPENPFILVDGSSYLFRAYHALPPLTTTKGQHTGAIFGVVNMLRKLLKEYKPDKMIVVFDSKEKNFRHTLYEAYKANRTVMPDELQSQIAPLHEIIKAMGLPLVVIPGFEADDIIGTLARRAKKAGLFTLISTGDKDFAQLVDEKTFLINTMSQEIYDHARVLEKFELPPERIIDYFALIGDSVDNIPGIPNVGPKTALKWLQLYGTLDNIIEKSAEISGKVGENLRTHLDKLNLFRDLVTIDCSLELNGLSESTDTFAISLADKEKLKNLFVELEFKSWLKELGVEIEHSTDQNLVHTTRSTISEDAQATGGTVSQDPNIVEHKERSYEILYEEASCLRWIQKLKQSQSFAFSIHTTDLNYMNAVIVGISISLNAGEAVYIPFGHDYILAPKQLARDFVLSSLRPLFEDANIKKIGHNLKYIAEILLNEGIVLKGIAYDTMLESYVLDSAGSRHDIETLAEKCLGHGGIRYEDIAGKGAKQIPFNQIPIENAGPYAANVADITLQLHGCLWEKLAKNENLKTIFNTIEMPLLSVLVCMERRGVLIDAEKLNAQSQELENRLQVLEKEAHAMVQQTFNLNSPKQLQEILFNQLKLPVLEKTPTGQPSTSEAVLQELAENYPLPKHILEYRSLSKLKSTYTDKLPEQMDAKTGRIHTSYHQAITSTGRLSSSDPNLQNIPIRTPEGRKIREAFIAESGYKIVTADYSQIELRIMAHLSQDETLLKAFNEDLDIHQSTAAEVFAVPLDTVTEDQRRSVKVINFGIIYGMSGFGLAKQLGVTRSEAEQYIERYFASFPRVKIFIQETLNEAKRQGYVETILGRRLYPPELNSNNVARRKAAERAAINAPMQGTNADLIKLAMIELNKFAEASEDKVRMIMQVHDELVFEVKNEFVESACQQIQTTMETIYPLSVKLKVGIGVGRNWDEAHK